jgi:hypothetical protein
MAANEHRSHNAPSSIIRQSIIFWTTGVAGSLDPATEAAANQGKARSAGPLPDKKRFGYYRLPLAVKTQGEALVDRMGYRLWGGCRCPIRGVRVRFR